ncbi:MAG: hypothetical protein ACPIOQ_56275, partial [Promethearchaeia archaeon]
MRTRSRSSCPDTAEQRQDRKSCRQPGTPRDATACFVSRRRNAAAGVAVHELCKVEQGQARIEDTADAMCAALATLRRDHEVAW